MPSRTVYIRRRVLDKLIEIARREGYVENGVVKWHHVLNELLERAVAMYELGQIKLNKKRRGKKRYYN